MGKSDITQMRLPIAVVAAIIIQSGGGIWYFAQQNATIATMESTIATLELNAASMIASIEDDTRDWVNLQRDVKDNTLFINDMRQDIKKEDTLISLLRTDVESILRRVTAIEVQLRYIGNQRQQVTTDQASKSQQSIANTANDKDYYGYPGAYY